MTIQKIKTTLAIIGGLTVAAAAAMAGLLAYLWWDTRNMDIDTDFEADSNTDN